MTAPNDSNAFFSGTTFEIRTGMVIMMSQITRLGPEYPVMYQGAPQRKEVDDATMSKVPTAKRAARVAFLGAILTISNKNPENTKREAGKAA